MVANGDWMEGLEPCFRGAPCLITPADLAMRNVRDRASVVVLMRPVHGIAQPYLPQREPNRRGSPTDSA